MLVIMKISLNFIFIYLIQYIINDEIINVFYGEKKIKISKDSNFREQKKYFLEIKI